MRMGRMQYAPTTNYGVDTKKEGVVWADLSFVVRFNRLDCYGW
jgi:hypothetical protein